MSSAPENLLNQLARAALRTAEGEISCDDLLDRLARYVESGAALIPGGDGAPPALPPELQAVRDHLAICPECSEEVALLLKAIQPTTEPPAG